MRARPRAVVFDLDGTLIDSRRDLAAAINLARQDFGLATLTLEEVVAMVGEGAARLVARALAEIGAERRPDALTCFFHHYDQRLLETTRPYPGIEAMLAKLTARYPLAVLTNKPERFCRRILEGLGLAKHFREVIGGDSLPQRKPDPAGLAELGRRFGAVAGELLLVGDSRIDAATAHAAGCPFAFVTWGFASPEERVAIREAGGADLVIDKPGELSRALG